MSELTRSDSEASLIIHHSHHTHHSSHMIRSIDEFIYSDAMHALPLISHQPHMLCIKHIALLLLSLSLSLVLLDTLYPKA